MVVLGYQAERYVARAQTRLHEVQAAVWGREPGEALRALTSALWCVSAAAAELVAWQREIGCTWPEIADAAGTDVHEAMRCWAEPARGVLRMGELDRRRRLRALADYERQMLPGSG